MNTLPFSDVLQMKADNRRKCSQAAATVQPAELLREKTTGRRRMIEELYQRYYRELTAWCRGMTQSESLAEDLVQEAFLRALINIEVLETLRENQRRAWLYRTVKNLYLDRVRHSAYETTKETVPEQTEIRDVYAEIDYGQLLEQLPGEEGVLFAMRYLQGYNSRELGRMFDLPEGTVRSKLFSARKHLRELLK